MANTAAFLGPECPKRREIPLAFSKMAKMANFFNGPLAIFERDLAIFERDLAIFKRDLAIFKRDLAIFERDLAIFERDLAIFDKTRRIRSAATPQPV